MTNVNAACCDGAEIVDLQGVLDELLQIRSEMIAECILSQRRLDDVHANHRESAQKSAALPCAPAARPSSTAVPSGCPWSFVPWGRGVARSCNGRCCAESDQPDHGNIVGNYRPTKCRPLVLADGRRLLAEHTEALLGAATPGRSVRIMVTMPGEAAGNYALVHELLQQGMNCMRINCAAR